MNGNSDALVTARAAAEAFNVPYTHMVKVVHRLSTMGFLTTTRGKGGGLRLSRPAESIRIGQVIRATEPAAPLIDCGGLECPLRFDCRLKDALDDANNAFFRELDRYTLAEISRMPLLEQLVQVGIGGLGRGAAPSL